MRIENQMLSRFNAQNKSAETVENSLSAELDFFFDNVMDNVVEFFKEQEEVKV